MKTVTVGNVYKDQSGHLVILSALIVRQILVVEYFPLPCPKHTLPTFYSLYNFCLFYTLFNNPIFKR
jgi:hypothetical protein